MALDPDYVSVDERSVKDLLAFAREYAKELKYYNTTNREAGDWSGFLGPVIDLDKVAVFMDSPAKFTPVEARQFFRPHFVLFLTFLKLIGHAQQQLNTLTRRHLEFYYQQALRMSKKSAVPDQVNILFAPADDVSQVLLPTGTLLSAGPDSQGQNRIYRTDHKIVVNHAQVARLSSLHVHKRITGIRDARERHTGPREEGFIRMFEIALGDPMPGDSLPAYDKDQNVDFAFLLRLASLLKFASTDLYMPLFELHTLRQLKLQRDQADAEWDEINRLLEKAGRKRTGNSTYKLEPTNPRDFNTNFEKAVSVRPDDSSVFGGITEVNDIYDLYDKWHRIFGNERRELERFVEDKLHFVSFDDFRAMTRRKIQIDNEWSEINRILEQAGQKKREDPSYRLIPEDHRRFDPTDFDANLNAAISPDFSKLADVANIDEYYAAVSHVEKYFCMSAENFSYILSVAENADETSGEWDKVYDILADAHKEKVYEGRRQQLRNKHDKEGFEAMICLALGEDPTQAEPSPLERLKEFVRKDNDYDFLKDISLKADAGQVTDKDWDRVYRIVEIAQRIREEFTEPVARKEEWCNLYPSEDATTAGVALGIDADKDNPRWKTFGRQRTEAGKDSTTPSLFGWAISSPLLALSESKGERKIILTLAFRSNLFDEDKIEPLLPKDPFLVEISTEKGWIAPDSMEVKQGDYPSLSGISNAESTEQTLAALQFTLTFGPDVDAIAPLPAEEAEIDTCWPVLRLMLRQIWNAETEQFISHYPPFKDLVLVRTHVKVDVAGLSAFQIQNDETVLDAKKPFEPFGTSPSVGSRFFLGHPELVYKRLDSLTFNVDWMGVPGNLTTHYTNYDLNWDEQNFTTCISLIDKRVVLPLEEKAPLFSSLTGVQAKQHSIKISDFPEALRAGRQGYKYERILKTPTEEDLLTWNRYLQWELNKPGFQHETYPALVAQKSIALAAAIANEGDVVAETYQLNPPYTPKIKKLSLDYTSSEEIILEEYKPGSQIDRIFHIHPFGHNEVQPEVAARGCFFLPQYNNEGQLYIGIKDVRPRQNVSILFQMAEGSADPEQEPVPIQWSYLSDNRWMSLHEGNILFDSTHGLINSGIITFDLEPVEPSTRLPRELYWIRAAVAQHSNSVCDTIAIHTQGVSATFVDKNNAPDHYSSPLPAGTITGPAEPMPEIASVRQPYTSYAAKMEELDNIFYTRVSERLRHKNRALTVWDYERLVLERFPQIYKAKCLPADAKDHPAEPGKVEIIVIPDIRGQRPSDPFEPRASAELISDIESYLSDKSPACATVKVRNALYVAVKVRVGVRFKLGCDEGYCKTQLNDELNYFLSPWAYEEGADIVIGGKIYANSIVNFIDERDYVDYVAAIKLFSSEDGRTFRLAQPSDSQGYFVTTDGPDGVLVAARRHEIDIISEVGYEHEVFTGINYMKIELDFIVG